MEEEKKRQNWHDVAHSGPEWRAFAKAKLAAENLRSGRQDTVDDIVRKFREKITNKLRRESEAHQDEMNLERDRLHGLYMVYLGGAVEKLIKESRAVVLVNH